MIGYNSRLDELQAAILNDVFLPRLAGWLDARRRIARTYLNGISSPALKPAGSPEDSNSSWHLFPVLVDPGRKGEVLSYFSDKGIAVAEHYPLALVEQNALGHLKGRLGSECHRAVRFCRGEISQPIHPYLTADEVALVVQACNEWH